MYSAMMLLYNIVALFNIMANFQCIKTHSYAMLVENNYVAGGVKDMGCVMGAELLNITFIAHIFQRESAMRRHDVMRK